MQRICKLSCNFSNLPIDISNNYNYNKNINKLYANKAQKNTALEKINFQKKKCKYCICQRLYNTAFVIFCQEILADL